MLFEEAYNKALDVIEQKSGMKTEVTKQTAWACILAWNMIALADGKFDDLAMLDSGLNRISIPKVKNKTVVKGSGDGGPKNP